MAFAWPWATRLVPSSGSTAMSMTTSSGPPVPTGSPIQSIGASSRSPSPMTMVPRISTSSIVARMASVAAWSASSLWPRPMWRADAQRGGLGDAHHLQCEQLLHGLDPPIETRQAPRVSGGTGDDP